MHKSPARVAVTVIASILLLGACVSKGSGEDNNTLTVMTNANILSGLTSASLKEKSTISSWYSIYHKLWQKQFPKMKIKEVKIGAANGSDTDTVEVTKTLLGVNSGNPTDLIGIHGQLPDLVKRGAVENLDKYYKAAGIKPSYFLKPLSDYVRYDGHWYGMPGASNPTTGTILYIPAELRKAGIDPRHLPDTFSELWKATKKVTKFGSNGQPERIGLPVDTNLNFIDFYCGRQTTYDASTNSFHANAPCVKDYVKYNKRLLDFYGGIQKYTKFISGDQTVWTCSPKAYIPTGKVLFSLDAYWSGAQMDTCYNVKWALGPPPTQHGLTSEWSALAPTAWVLAIPKGAKNPQLAFDFVKYTIWEHGDLLGPTTNGYDRPDQAEAWGSTLIDHQAQVRKQNGYPGNPMAQAMQIVTRGASLGKAIYPKNANATYFNEQMGRAWQQISYGRQSVDAALDNVQRLIDAKR